jgi:holo-[acyl-carrier protein] synthase
MILGIGSDIVKVARIEKLLSQAGNRFCERIFSPKEISYAETRARPELHFAARFAAKEAFVKALGCGFRDGLEWRDIEVINNNLGRPELKLHGQAQKFCQKLEITNTWLSLSHEQEFALAFVVLEGHNPRKAAHTRPSSQQR